MQKIIRSRFIDPFAFLKHRDPKTSPLFLWQDNCLMRKRSLAVLNQKEMVLFFIGFVHKSIYYTRKRAKIWITLQVKRIYIYIFLYSAWAGPRLFLSQQLNISVSIVAYRKESITCTALPRSQRLQTSLRQLLSAFLYYYKRQKVKSCNSTIDTRWNLETVEHCFGNKKMLSVWFWKQFGGAQNY